MGPKTNTSLCVLLQFHAMDTLHATGYDITRAIAALVPQGGPVLCRDEMEEWSASEANLFEEALEKYGKDFTDIQQDFVSRKPAGRLLKMHSSSPSCCRVLARWATESPA